MASFCRSAAVAASRSVAGRTKTLARSPAFFSSTSSSPFTSPSPLRLAGTASRVVSTIGSVDSLMPFHTATANSRLVSTIAADSSCWSWLSQGFATPL